MRHALMTVKNFYGAAPLHLLALVICFALAGYAAVQTFPTSHWPWILVWFAGAAVGHDLIVFPLYALADRSLVRALRSVRPSSAAAPAPVPAVNHIRVPALGAGLLFLLFFPLIIQKGRSSYLAATGRTQQAYLGHWLLITAALFALSALIYALRLGSASQHRRTRGK
ncbi:hypothetical protein [Actinomadura macra]|uniref:hypothetical protein n=1 Tax=Actinomadura macra TaxID=46164 RepID=UPI00082AE583|nr:hypothetical protein [Actinomadura macra]